MWCLPPRVWRPPHRARCVHRPAAAFNVYKSSRSLLFDHLPSSIFSQRSLARPLGVSPCALYPSCLGPPRILHRPRRSWESWRCSRFEARTLDHSGLDALDCRDGDHSSESRRIGRDTSMNSSSAPSPRRRTITTPSCAYAGNIWYRCSCWNWATCVGVTPRGDQPVRLNPIRLSQPDSSTYTRWYERKADELCR